MDNYDRMNPTLEGLAQRLREYNAITYGANAYQLSVAEAKLLVNAISYLEDRFMECVNGECLRSTDAPNL